MHPCHAEGCGALVKDGILMCLTHWRKVSTATQDLVYRKWRAYRKEPTLATVRAYRAAVEQAKLDAGRAS